MRILQNDQHSIKYIVKSRKKRENKLPNTHINHSFENGPEMSIFA